MNGMTDSESGIHSKDVPSNMTKTSDLSVFQDSAVVACELSCALRVGDWGF